MSLTTPKFFRTLRLPLTVAVSSALLVACNSTPKQTQEPTATTISQPSTQTPTLPEQTAATGTGVLDAETLSILDDLLAARDMSMVEGGRMEVLRYGDLWDRVRRGYKITQPSYNARIEAQKAWFSSRQSYLDALTARASRYIYHTVSEAERRGIPTELALLPIIESSYDPAATSNASAAGLWQFIPSTGRIYGLNQTPSYDGRRDVIESTRAAYDFLTSLYNQFGSWELALAAYNAGPGRIQRAIDANAAQGLPTDYWSLRLPTETMNYVPRFMAVAQIIQNPAMQGVSLPAIANHAHFRAVAVNQGVSLNEVSSVTGVPVYELQLLNPALTNLRVDSAGPGRVLIPNSVPNNLDISLSAIQGYGVSTLNQNSSYIAPKTPTVTNSNSATELAATKTFPTTSASVTPNKTVIQEPPLSQEEINFIASQISQNAPISVQPINPTDGKIELDALQTAQSVLDARGQKKSLNYPNTTNTQVPSAQPYTAPVNQLSSTQSQSNSTAKSSTYVVKAGDTLTGIAQKHGVTVSQLRAWNNMLPSDTLKSGARLTVVSNNSTSANTASNSTAVNNKTAKAKTNEMARVESHTVKAGETLSGIAGKYNLSLTQIAEYNNITTSTRVQAGQKLWVVPNKVKPTTQTKTVAPKTTSQTQTYKVQSGDTLTSVANKYNVSLSELATANQLSTNDGLVRGKTIVIPTSGNAPTKATATQALGKVISKTENYKVKAGDSLTSLANKYGVSVADLARTNNLATNAKLTSGSTIKVPKLTTTHSVKSGESLNSLAKKYDISVSELAQMNDLKTSDKLKKGQTLTVPNR